MRTSIAEHRALVDAVIAHDPERAEALATEHMREARLLRLRMLAEDH
jgi:DNA-binding GntR family transcriptional regulator